MSVSGSLDNIADHEEETEKKWRPTLKGNLIILGLLVVYLLFNLFGAYIFIVIERQPSVSKVNWFAEFKDQFVSNHSSCLSRDELEIFVQNIELALEDGANIVGNDSTLVIEDPWTLHSAFLLAFTIASTIGYGILTPATPGGQVFCIFFALLSIPFTGLLAAKMGNVMAYHIEQVANRLIARFPKAKVLSVVFTFVVGILLHVALPSILLFFVSNEEGWSYIECLYTVFITLTTVGFGDFVPNPSSHGGMYTTIFVTIWVIAGLAWFATIFTLIATIMSARAKSFRRTMTTKKTNIINRVKRKNVTPAKSSLSTQMHTEENIGDN
ncbi:potassium channel, subfamily K, member 16-like [Ciona intestinalis]